MQRRGRAVVVVDADPERVAGIPFPTVVADATLDDTLRAPASPARALVAALAGDAENLFVTLSGRALNPALFIVARARQDDSVSKLTPGRGRPRRQPAGAGRRRGWRRSSSSPTSPSSSTS